VRDFRSKHGAGFNNLLGSTVVILVIVRELEGFVVMVLYLNIRNMPIKHIDRLRNWVVKFFGFFSSRNSPNCGFSELFLGEVISF